MIKLYLLSIIFNLGSREIAVSILKSRDKKSKFDTFDKRKKKEARRLKYIIAFTPFINILIGILYILVSMGIFDDIENKM